MSKMTLLDMVQDILSDMTSDEVNSISDTVESLQVAQIIKSTYYNLVSQDDYPHRRGLTQLTPSGDVAKPTHMKLPDDIISVKWVKYDKATSTDTNKKYGEVVYLHPDKFIEKIVGRNSANSNVVTVSDVVELFIINDTAPSFYTSFDDEYVIFDSFDSAVDTTLRNSKTQVYAELNTPWSMENEFIPDLTEKLFPYLLSTAKATCFTRIKQMTDVSSEEDKRRHRTRVARNKWRVNGGIRLPNYGRK